jgi:hypothetical protein
LLGLEPGAHHRHLLRDESAQLLDLRDLLRGDLMADLQAFIWPSALSDMPSAARHGRFFGGELIGCQARRLQRAGDRIAVRVDQF